VGFGLTFLFMSLLVNWAGIPYLAAQVATTGIVMFWSFAAHRIWTFSAGKTANRTLGQKADVETSFPPS
jgi:putative flippase GtrA